MCSIFGIYGEYKKEETLKAFSTLKHRGPDEYQIIDKKNLFLGSHRLKIVDSAYEKSIYQQNNAFLLFNGEIYNYKELAKELDIQNPGEREVIVEGWKRWKEQLFEKLRGMYAIAIIYNDNVILARDIFGKKPLYYLSENDRLSFGSELKALENIISKKQFDTKVLHKYLFFQSPPAPYTFDAQIRQLPPGTCMIFEKSRLKSKNHILPFENFKKYKKSTKKIEPLLKKAIKSRIPKDVKWGALLSGGIDSSLVATIASGMQNKIDTFCIGYEDYQKYDEREWARIVAENISSNHTEFIMSKEDFLKSANELFDHLDEPLADPASIPLWFMMKSISKMGYKVILSGDGADELFLGYRLYPEFADIEKAKELKHKNWLRNYFKANYSPNREWERYKRVFEGSILFRSTAELFSDLQINALLKQNIKDNLSIESLQLYIDRFKESKRDNYTDWYSYLDTQILLSGLYLKKLDRISMAHSIETRSPFLDIELSREIFNIEPSIRFGNKTKAILKDIAKSYLPSEIIDRKKKGFSYPFIEWLDEAGELDRIRDLQTRRGWFVESALDELLKKGKKRKSFKKQIFALYALARWDEKRSY